MCYTSIYVFHFYWAEVSETYPIFVVWNWHGVLLVFLFLGYQFCLEIIYGVFQISIVFSCSKYCFPFFLLWFFCDGECYHSVYIVSECWYFMLMWMVRGKLNGDISACGFSIDTYVHVVIVSMYGNVQIIYCVVFFCRHFKLKVFYLSCWFDVRLSAHLFCFGHI